MSSPITPWPNALTAEMKADRDMVDGMCRRSYMFFELLADSTPMGGEPAGADGSFGCALWWRHSPKSASTGALGFITFSNTAGLEADGVPWLVPQAATVPQQLQPAGVVKMVSVRLAPRVTLPQTEAECTVLCWDGVDFSPLAAGTAEDMQRRQFRVGLLPGQVKALLFVPPDVAAQISGAKSDSVVEDDWVLVDGQEAVREDEA